MPLTFQPSPSTARLEMIFTQDAQRVENVYHVTYSAAFSIANLNAVIAIFRSWWSGSAKGYAAASVVPTLAIASSLETATAPTVEASLVGDAVGTRSSPGMPMNVTVAVSLRTALRGRSYRGRIYHIGLTEDMVASSVLLPVYVGDLVGNYDYLRSLLAAGGFTLAVLSRVSGGVRRPTGVATAVTGTTVDAFLDSQRRRLPGRGR